MTIIHLHCRAPQATPAPSPSIVAKLAVAPTVVEPDPQADYTTDETAEETIAQLMWRAADMVTAASSKADKFCVLRLYGYCFPDHSDAYTEAQINQAWALHEEVLSYGNKPTDSRINQLMTRISDIGFGRE